MTDYTGLAVSGCLDAVRRYADAGEDLVQVGKALAEVLFWWRALDLKQGDHHTPAPGLGEDLTQLRPALVWTRNLSTHEGLVVRDVAGFQYPVRYPISWSQRILWRPVDQLPEPTRGTAAWKMQQVESYRRHLAGARPEEAVEVIRLWAERLA